MATAATEVVKYLLIFLSWFWFSNEAKRPHENHVYSGRHQPNCNGPFGFRLELQQYP